MSTSQPTPTPREVEFCWEADLPPRTFSSLVRLAHGAWYAAPLFSTADRSLSAADVQHIHDHLVWLQLITEKEIISLRQLATFDPYLNRRPTPPPVNGTKELLHEMWKEVCKRLADPDNSPDAVKNVSNDDGYDWFKGVLSNARDLVHMVYGEDLPGFTQWLNSSTDNFVYDDVRLTVPELRKKYEQA